MGLTYFIKKLKVEPIMKINHFRVVALLILSASIMAGCKSLRKSIAHIGGGNLIYEEIIENVHYNHLTFNTFSARFSANTKFGNNDFVFNGSLRIVKDSAIFISATLPILSEVARVVITPDSLKFLNRLEALYFVGNITYLNRLIGADLDYHILEAILMGNDPVHFSHSNTKVANEKDAFVLTSNNRIPRNNPFAAPLENRMRIDTGSFRIRQNIFFDNPANRMVRTNYNAHTIVQEQSVPVEIEMFFSEPSNSLFVSMKLSGITIDSKVNISFSVPKGYTPMDI